MFSLRSGDWGSPQQANNLKTGRQSRFQVVLVWCDSTYPCLLLLYRKSYAEKVQEVEKDPEIPVSFRNAVQKNRYNNNGDNKFRNSHH